MTNLIEGANMTNFIGCITAFVLALVLRYLDIGGYIDIGDREIKIITLLGWGIAIYVAKGEIL